MWTKHWSVLVEIGQVTANIGRCWPNSTQLEARVDRLLVNFGELLSTSANFDQSFFPRIWGNLGQHRPACGPHRRMLVESGPNLGSRRSRSPPSDGEEMPTPADGPNSTCIVGVRLPHPFACANEKASATETAVSVMLLGSIGFQMLLCLGRRWALIAGARGVSCGCVGPGDGGVVNKRASRRDSASCDAVPLRCPFEPSLDLTLAIPRASPLALSKLNRLSSDSVAGMTLEAAEQGGSCAGPAIEPDFPESGARRPTKSKADLGTDSHKNRCNICFCQVWPQSVGLPLATIETHLATQGTLLAEFGLRVADSGPNWAEIGRFLARRGHLWHGI